VRCGVEDGAGDWGRGEVEAAVFCGGPFAQADFVGSGAGGIFDAVAVEDLLILRHTCISTFMRKNEPAGRTNF
jgi:hypothetical protein